MARRKGLSLVEVLAALTLIAGTMTVLLLAQAQSLRQLAATRKAAEAHRRAEQLILSWKVDPASVTPEGAFDGSTLHWLREEAPSWLSASRELREVRLRIYGRDAQDGVLAEYVWLEEPKREDRR